MTGKTRNVHKAIAAVAVGLAFVACDDVTGPNPLDDALVMDMALVAADATLEDLTMWTQPIGFAPLASAPAQVGFPGGPGRPGGQGAFSGTFSGMRSVTFVDAGGIEQDGYDALTTDTIHIMHEIAGEVARENWSASIQRERDMTASGLAGEETHRTWNGSGNEELSRAGVLDDGTERSHASTGSFEYLDVVVPIPGSENRYPVSGTITRSMTVTRSGPDGVTTRSVDIEITFDGTSIAQAIVNGEPMEIDLSTREGHNPLRRVRR